MVVRGRHIRLIQSYALRHMIRGGAGLVLLITTLFFGLTVASVILAPIDQVESDGRPTQVAVESVVSMAQRPVEWILLGSAGEDPAPEVVAQRERWSGNLLHDRPAVLLVGGVLLVGSWGGAQNEYLGLVKYALPWGLQNRLFAPDVGQVLLAIGACLGYAAAFAWLGYRKFSQRDL